MESPIEITLPPAPPRDYLSWMAFWREVEAKMLTRPQLEAFSSKHSAPFLHDYVARFISTVLVRDIMTQAHEADGEGRAEVAPVLRADPQLLMEALGYVRKRAEWMSAPEVMEAMGIEPLEEPLVRLRARVVETLGDQLTNAQVRSASEESQEGRLRR